MSASLLTRRRLHRQRIASGKFDSPAEVVAWLGAVQAQDYLASLWAIGLRMREATAATVEQAIAERRIVRTWPMRGTLHFVAAEDVRWMSALLTPRVIAGSAARLRRDFGLDEAALARCRRMVTDLLQGGKVQTRSALYAALDTAGVDTAKQRGQNIIGRLAQEGLLCLGPRVEKQPTFVLLDEWVPASRSLTRDKSLAELARRYFGSHGPATLHDFAWWSGLTIRDAQLGIELAGADLQSETLVDKVHWQAADAVNVDDASDLHLLPAFDEYLVAYKDRSAAVDVQFNRRVIGINGLFNPCIVVDGRIVGTWKRSLDPKAVAIELKPFRPLLKRELAALNRAARRYGDFIGLPARVSPAGS